MTVQPLVPPLCGLIAGLLVGRYVPVPSFVVVMCAVGAVGLNLLVRRRNVDRALIVSLTMLLFAAGLWRIGPVAHPEIAANHLAHWVGQGRIDLEGVVVEPPHYFENERGAFVLEARRIHTDHDQWTHASGRIRIYIYRDLPLEPGETVRLKTRVRYVAAPRTPAVADPSWASICNQVLVNGRLPARSLLTRVAPAPFSLSAALDRVRRSVRETATRISPDHAWLVRSLVLGERNVVPQAMYDSFRQSGVGHVFVVSGLHVTAVAGLFFALLWYLLSRFPSLTRRYNVARAAALASIPAAVLYTGIAGAGTSVLRACVMFVIVLAAIYFGRRRSPLNSLAAAGIVVLLVYPGALWQAGFQFSFAAVGGMIHWRHVGRRWLGPRSWSEKLFDRRAINALRRWFVRVVVMSVAAFLATVPVSLWHFGAIAPAAPLANLVALPVFGTLVVPPLLLGAVVAPIFPSLANLAWTIASLAADQVFGAMLLIESWGARQVFPGRPHPIELLAYLALFLSWPFWERRWAKRVIIAAATALLCLTVSTAVFRAPAGSVEVTMLDVGQGMSIHVKTPDGRQLLIDGGYDPNGRFVVPYLAAQGVRRLDAVVVTHADPDHFTGLLTVLERLDVGELWTAPPPFAAPFAGQYLLLLDRARAKGIPIRELTASDIPSTFGQTRVEVLNPPPQHRTLGNANDGSLALRLSWGTRRFLVLGDIEMSAEQRILAAGLDLSADLAQVGHHGSATSSSEPFVRRVGAKNALIPVGFQNHYHHPRAIVVKTWKNTGATVWRTDIDGAVRCRNNCTQWTCRSIAPAWLNPLLAGDSGDLAPPDKY